MPGRNGDGGFDPPSSVVRGVDQVAAIEMEDLVGRYPWHARQRVAVRLPLRGTFRRFGGYREDVPQHEVWFGVCGGWEETRWQGLEVLVARRGA